MVELDLSYSEASKLKYDLYNEAVRRDADQMGTIPHCDSRILHSPDECMYCADRPGLVTVRELLGIAFTGHEPTESQIPCEADLDRPMGSVSDHRKWGGNKPTSAADEPGQWPEETFASRVFYGEPEDRVPFKATRDEKRFAPWYMKAVCRNDEGTTTGYRFKWWAKPIQWWLWRTNR